ncbi:hypothetical protein [Methylobacterium nodulans]|uniref:Uncharacterized protein n=1 Tax=Methylobacterium nodulans (strain LMG 21967 / CNCM I-2342 / ORS 2060) TaxID=460265 RepID=B8IE04_METNO|nr:hypothetical protein [Methylobacterium nodulans]ACL57550.1 conserved hypothetical protein [Methylobacterium nodulans ORS 2060]
MSALDAYSVFCRKHKPGVRCAVLQDWPVPDFVRGDAWDYVGTIYTTDPLPLGFKPKAAREGMERNGYYLFQVLNA